MPRESVSLSKGTHTINGIVAAGNVTGSGNYVDFCLPFALATNISTVAANIGNGRLFMEGYSVNLAGSLTFAIIRRGKNSVILEYHLPQTQSSYKPATIAIVESTFTLS